MTEAVSGIKQADNNKKPLTYEFYNRDCLEAMKEYPDNFFSLAIVDPPYNLGKALMQGGDTGVVKFKYQYEDIQWDTSKPTHEYFLELFRVSKNQIIWGANYFLNEMNSTRGIIMWDPRGMVLWDKKNGHPYNFSHFEMAWTSFPCIARKCEISNTGDRIHPTQKPVGLYRWLLHNYAEKGQLILDTHVGSASSLIACEQMGFSYVGFELNTKIYNMAKARIEEERRLPQLSFDDFQFEDDLPEDNQPELF